MTEQYQRYAIYFAPRPGSNLTQFGREWLGMDAESGFCTNPPSPYVESPRRYGFHATLKAPMRLGDGVRFEEFRSAVLQLSNELKPINLGQPRLKSIRRFLALTVDKDFHKPVSDLAWQCVTKLDLFRAHLNETERNKRPNLSERQTAYLEKWGYPYIGDEFRFHMTLTSSLNEDELNSASQLIVDNIPDEETWLDSICIFGDPDGSKPFELVERFDLKG